MSKIKEKIAFAFSRCEWAFMWIKHLPAGVAEHAGVEGERDLPRVAARRIKRIVKITHFTWK